MMIAILIVFVLAWIYDAYFHGWIDGARKHLFTMRQARTCRRIAGFVELIAIIAFILMVVL